MAEIGALASMLGVAGAGIKLSFALFDLAERIGSAGEEVKLVATELSLFCSTLQALKSTLEDTENVRYTPAAYNLIDRVIEEFQSTIAELEKIVVSLTKEPGALSDFPSLEWTSRVKWTFKKSKVQLHRQTLESCKSTLHLLLSTLQWSRRTSVQKVATTATSREDEQYQMVTQGLVMAVRAAVNQLRTAEAAANKEDDTLPSDSRMSRLLSGLSLQTSKPQDDLYKPRRTSTWLDKLIFDEEPEAAAHPGQRQPRLSSATTARDPLLLLRKWTEDRPRRVVPATEIRYENPFGSQDFVFTSSLHMQKLGTGIPVLGRVATGLVSPKSSIISPTARRTFITPISEVSVANFHVAVEDANLRQTSAQYLSTMLDHFGLDRDREAWELVAIFGGQEKIMQPSDVPNTVLEELSKYSLNPRFVVRQSKSVIDGVMTSSPTIA